MHQMMSHEQNTYNISPSLSHIHSVSCSREYFASFFDDVDRFQCQKMKMHMKRKWDEDRGKMQEPVAVTQLFMHFYHYYHLF
jgi:hypothetical protein